jgi:hypothetical protein
MSRKPWTVEAVLDDINSAVADVRAVAEAQGDESRKHTAGYLEELFVDVTDRRSLRRAAGRALGVYSGGSGSFSDVGGPAQYRVVEQLRVALRRGRSWFLRNPQSTAETEKA